MTEKSIEKAVCKKAKEFPLLVYKFVSPNRRGVPDRMFIRRDRVVFFIEFKATGKDTTPLQDREISRLEDSGCTVYVVDNVGAGVMALEVESEEACLNIEQEF